MNNAIRLGLIGAGGYALWRYLSSQGMLTSSWDWTGANGASEPEASPVFVDTPALVERAAIAAGYPAGSLLTGDEWNYFYAQVRGTNGLDPSIIWPSEDRAKKRSLLEWWTTMHGAGLSALIPDPPASLSTPSPAWVNWLTAQIPPVSVQLVSGSSNPVQHDWFQDNQNLVYAGAGAVLLLLAMGRR